MHTIVAQGGKYVKLYEETDEYGFIGHNFEAISISNNIFTFKYSSMVSSNSLVSGVTSITNGSNIYFRKDDWFYTWLRNNSTEYRDYLNVNKRFLYFGKIWPSSTQSGYYTIEFEGLKDFMLNALPPINQTTAMDDWLKAYFDGTHHQIYNLTKNIWSMRDAKEIDIRFLQYIANDYGIDITEDITTELALREWVENLIYFLKRKGAYSTLFVVFKFLLTNTTNTLNIYERWHDWGLSAFRDAPTEDDWTDHHILEYYGEQPSGAAGNDYYSRYDPSAYPVYASAGPPVPSASIPSAGLYPILSPHYRVEIDLTSEPLGDDYIINETFIDELIRYWEYTKPVSRFVNYTELVAPDAQIDGTAAEEVSTYSVDETAYLTTKFTGASYLSSEQSSAGFGNDTYNHPQETSDITWSIINLSDSYYTPPPDYSMYWSSTQQDVAFGGAMANPLIAIKQTSNGSTQNIIATQGRSSGKYYFEVEYYGTSAALDNSTVGIRIPSGAGGGDYDSYIGSTNRGMAYMAQGRFYSNGSNLTTNPDSWGAADTLVRIGVAVDFSLGYIWFSKNGVYQSALGDSPDPVTGTDPAVTGIAGTWYPGISIYYVTVVTATLKATANRIDNLPSGFSAWDAT